jgi:hypothetical protein
MIFPYHLLDSSDRVLELLGGGHVGSHCLCGFTDYKGEVKTSEDGD